MGLTRVESGARLSGQGTIGGDVTVADGAIFAPGFQPFTPATLAINGDLTLSENTNVFYNLVTPGEGGALNDLANIGGDLTLDGVINVLDPGADLSVGVYRIFNYDGALTDNTMTVGTFMNEQLQPTGRTMDDFYVQVSIPGQVNLVNTAGLELTFWDGEAAANENNNVIDGGVGTWRIPGAVEPDTDNWTDAQGAVNAPWANGSFAIFTGQADTVTVSNANGDVQASGMQFMTDGYQITGDTLTLIPAAGGTSVIRVGGGPNDPNVTATIDAVLQGNTTLQQTGSGTLVLTGDNTYTGGTIVDGGTLQISADTNLGAPGTGLTLSGGTLHTTADIASNRPVTLGAAGGTFQTDPGTTLTLEGAVGGSGALTKTGEGELVLGADNTYGGGTTISAGRLQLGAGGTSGSIGGNVTNNGTLAFNRSDTYTFDGLVSGSGALDQAGTGTTVLTANHTYTGGTTISDGTLQLGAGGTSGSIAGNVTNNGTLAFNRSDTYTFGGIVSGSGSLLQNGSGTTILTAENTYSGGTTISEGRLQLGAGGTSGSIVGDVTNNGTFTFNRSDIYTFSGAISGSGALEQIGTGTTVLTADNAYSGGTTITQGTLQLGAGGTTGSIVGNVTNNGILAVDRSDTLTVEGQIIGSGQLIQQGAGTTILTANNTYSGGTTISDGTLQLGDGGDTGAIIGDVLNNGTLAFNHADVLPIPGTISGSGNLIQRGPGATILLGNNSYAGPTAVEIGALYINGDQSAATGITSVASGATIGGTGVIGGDVTIADGATLAPGDIGVAPGTLTINGDLGLSSGSLLEYSFGQADVVGGPFNDLTIVEGDLVLDGTLNVITSPGGTFDPGVYRVISYGGGFTNNGLTIGTIPSPDFFLQTSVAQQINLINTAGLTFNYWDGDLGPKDDGVIDGGDGTWQSSAGNDNWTNALGVPNAPFTDAAFAIFMAAPGTVSVDNSLGDVTVSGMQFASDGYLIEGDTLTLVPTTTGNGAIIRVGDGSGPGADFTATIDTVLQGNVALVKTDLGRLVLNADNAYSGGTAINGGTVQISSDTNLGLSGTGLSMNSGTLAVSADMATDRTTTLGDAGGTLEVFDGVTFTHEGMIGGTGGLTKSGEGVAVLTADNDYAGLTTISQGTLQLGAGGTTGSITGNVVNDGVLAFNRSDTYRFDGLISGFGALEQNGTGTTILTADNIYEGGTTISDGTLQLGTGGTTGAIIGDVANDGTLVFNRSNTLPFAGAISGTGAVQQVGTGTTVLSGANTYGGPTTVAAGTLQAGATNTFSPNSIHDVGSGGTLDLAGFSQRVAGLSNAGRVFTNGTGPDTRLTVNGTYSGVGGLLALNTVLGRDGSPSDRLVIDGGSATGTTTLAINNLTGLGAVTTGSGILVIDAVNGATTSPGAFALAGPVVAGPYEYSLFRGDGNPEAWYLRSTLDCSVPGAPVPPCPAPEPPLPPDPPGPPVPDYRPETSLYPALPSLALRYGNTILDSLDERMGGGRSLQYLENGNLAWARIIGSTGSQQGGELGVYGDGGPAYDFGIAALQTGMDLYRAQNPDGSFDNAGIYLAYGNATADVTHFDGTFAGTNHLDAVTLGGYWTHFGAEGWYIDGVVQGTWYDATASGRLPGMRTNGFGFGASLEAGYPIELDNGFVIEPQAQLTYQSINLNSSSDVGAAIRFHDVQSLVGRVGVRVSRSWELEPDTAETEQPREATAWVRGSLVQEFMGQPVTEFSSEDGYVPFQDDTGGLGLRLDAGLEAEIAQDVSFYGNLSYQHQLDGGGHSFGGKVGLKIAF